jgi:hypothetical protein
MEELKTGHILDIINAGTFLITDDKNSLSTYYALDEEDRNEYIKGTPPGKCEEVSKNRVLSASDKRVKKYAGFYRCISSSKYETFINTKKELDKFFVKGNSIFFIAAKIKVKYFFAVVILGLFQFIFGGVMQYFKICGKLYFKKYEIRKYSQNNKKKDSGYRALLQEQEALVNNKYEISRSFIALIVSILAFLFSIFGKVNK